MRIAAVLKDRCQTKKCNTECIKYCPKVRTGVQAIWLNDSSKAEISEELCAGCGICVHKCPFTAIKIIGLPDELKEDMVHQYGENAFRLYRLPTPKKGQVTGILGPNGIGKSTSFKLLSGEIVPNLGRFDSPPSREEVLAHFAGSELHDYLEKVYTKGFKSSMKPQYVDKLPTVVKGPVRDLLSKVQERMTVEEAHNLRRIRHHLRQMVMGNSCFILIDSDFEVVHGLGESDFEFHRQKRLALGGDARVGQQVLDHPLHAGGAVHSEPYELVRLGIEFAFIAS